MTPWRVNADSTAGRGSPVSLAIALMVWFSRPMTAAEFTSELDG